MAAHWDDLGVSCPDTGLGDHCALCAEPMIESECILAEQLNSGALSLEESYDGDERTFEVPVHPIWYSNDDFCHWLLPADPVLTEVKLRVEG